MGDFRDYRESYTKSELLEENALKSPIEMFQRWMVDAINDNILEPNAMLLSTVDEKNIPHSRTVLLKEVENEEFIFYTNYQSNKAQQIEQNPHVTLVFMWLKSQRQVIITGTASKVSEEKSIAYFQSRPRGSQIGAWTSPQSTIINDRSILNERKAKIIAENEGKEVLDKPPFWGGFGVKPLTIEFWQGRDNRLHDRLKYKSTTDGNWEIIRLAP